jgi:hypothetical protein
MRSGYLAKVLQYAMRLSQLPLPVLLISNNVQMGFQRQAVLKLLIYMKQQSHEIWESHRKIAPQAW